MERWAANTLRALGIILTGGFVMVTSLILLLLSMCAAQGDFGGNKHPEQVVPYLVGAGAVLVIGIWFIAWLGRSIYRSMATAEPLPAGISPRSLTTPSSIATEGAPSVPLHLSPLGRKAIERLVYAMAAQIVLSGIAWIFGQFHFWSAPRVFAPHNWILGLLAPFVIYHVPYAVLIYMLLKRPSRLVFAYSLAVPAVLVLQSLFSLGVVGYYYVRQPGGFLLLFLPWLIHIVIVVLAYQAIQQVGLHPPPSSLIVAAIVTYIFFNVIHGITSLLYRFVWR